MSNLCILSARDVTYLYYFPEQPKNISDSGLKIASDKSINPDLQIIASIVNKFFKYQTSLINLARTRTACVKRLSTIITNLDEKFQLLAQEKYASSFENPEAIGLVKNREAFDCLLEEYRVLATHVIASMDLEEIKMKYEITSIERLFPGDKDYKLF